MTPVPRTNWYRTDLQNGCGTTCTAWGNQMPGITILPTHGVLPISQSRDFRSRHSTNWKFGKFLIITVCCSENHVGFQAILNQWTYTSISYKPSSQRLSEMCWNLGAFQGRLGRQFVRLGPGEIQPRPYLNPKRSWNWIYIASVFLTILVIWCTRCHLERKVIWPSET